MLNFRDLSDTKLLFFFKRIQGIKLGEVGLEIERIWTCIFVCALLFCFNTVPALFWHPVKFSKRIRLVVTILFEKFC